jgi:hypothetical protein
MSLAVFAPSSMAAIIAADNFNYTLFELNSQNGGSGWAGAWSAIPSVTQIVDPVVDLIDNRALQFTGNNDSAASRSLASAFTGNQLFVDFYVQIDSGSLINNDFLALWLNASTSSPNIGIKADEGVTNKTNDVFVRTTGSAGSYVPNSNIGSTNDVTHHIVGLLSKSVGNYNKFEVWLDPVLVELSSPDATFSGDSGISQITKVGFRSVNLDSGDVVLVDDLRLSTTWNEALRIPVAIPEPATLALLGLGLLGMVGLRRKP